MGAIPGDVREYLVANYTPTLSGVFLGEATDRPERSARRYLALYRKEIANSISRPVIPAQNMEGVVFDIETTDFGTEGYAGRLICCSFLSLVTGEVDTLEIEYKEHGDDRRLLEDVTRRLSQYSFHIGHNIASYDYNWLNSRLMYYGMEKLNSAVYFDTYQVAKALAIKTRKGLGNLIDYFGLEGVKTTIYRTSWSGVSSPYQTDFDLAMAEIVEHCALDVEANRRLFDVLHYYSLTSGNTCPWKISKSRGNYWKHLTHVKK